MPTQNFAGNIIVNLASLPDFLRRPILKKRMGEFFSMPEGERNEVIANALEAGPTIPFPNFARLFRTWLEVLADLPEEQRRGLFSAYIRHGARHPEKLVAFNLDGILGTFLELDGAPRQALAGTIRGIIGGLDAEQRRRIMLVMHDSAKRCLGIQAC